MREVDEELRREQVQTMWKRYGRIAVIVIVLFLVGFAAFLFWRAESAKTAERQGEELAAAIADIQASRNSDASKKIEALAADGRPGYRAAALFTKAGLANDRGDAKAAAAIYAGIAANDDFARPFRDLAIIRQTLVEYDKLSPQQVIDRMKPFAVADSAFFGTAGELTAIAMIRANRPAEAGRLLAAVARDNNVPTSLRARAARLATSLGVDVAIPADKD